MRQQRGLARAVWSRRRFLGAGMAGVSAAFLAACGGGKETGTGGAGAVATAPGTGTGAAGAATAVGAGEQPKRGGSLTVRIVNNPPFDLVSNSTYLAATFSSYVYSRLLKLKSGPDPNEANNLDIVPDLAQGYEVADEGLTYIFKLRPNARFHDIAPINGRAVTGEDVVASVERFRTEPRNQNRGIFQAPAAVIDKMETPDAQTVVFKLARRYASFLSLFANSYYVYIYPKEVNEKAVDPARQVIGTGPFIFESFQPDISVKLKRNPAYFLPGQPYVDTAEIVILREDVQEVAQLQAGRLDVSTTVPGFPADQVAEFRRTNPRAQIFAYLDGLHDYIAMQQRGDSPFRDERVRRAVTMAIDKNALLTLRFEGKGVWHSAVPAWHARYWLNPQGPEAGEAARWVKYDSKGARDLLRAAGQEGLKFAFRYTPNGYGERYNQAAEAIAAMLKDAGFAPTIVAQDYTKEWVAANGVTSGNFDGIAYGLSTRYSDPHEYLFTANHSKSTRNPAGVSDPQLDALIDKEIEELDFNRRVALIKDVQRYIMDKAYYGYGAVGNGYAVAQPWVRNYTRNAAYGQGAEMAINVWMDK